MNNSDKAIGNRQTNQKEDISAEKYIDENSMLCLKLSTWLVYNGWQAVAQGPRNTVNAFMVVTSKNKKVLPKIIRFNKSDPKITSDFYFSYWYTQSCNKIECLYNKLPLTKLSGNDWDYSYVKIEINEANYSACGLNIYSWLNDPYNVEFDFE